MNTHTFRAPNLKAAYEEVQRQLGPEALIVSVRQIMDDPAWQVWRKPGVEVIALPPPGMEKPPEKEATHPEKDEWETGGEPLLVTPPGRKTSPPSLESLLEKSMGAPPLKADGPSSDTSRETAQAGIQSRIPAGLREIRQRLLDQKVDQDLVQKVIGTSIKTLSQKAIEDSARLSLFVRQQLEACIRTTNGGGLEEVMVVVGSRGSGKTSTIAKMAAYYSHQLGKDVAWVCADTVRAGAIAEARIYTESLGIPLHVVYSPEELGPVIQDRQGKRLMLVDTPGCNPRNEASMVELGALLTKLPKKTVYCITPATGKESDLAQTLSAFKPFGLSGVIVTKMDETNQFGDIFNLAWRTQIPLRYFTRGPRAFDDLDPGMASTLVLALTGEA